MSALRGLLERPGRTHGPRVGVVLGDPGMGKTRLLAEVARHVTGRSEFHLAGFEPERRVPLGAAAGLFRGLIGLGDEGERLDSILRATDPEPGGLEPLRVFESAYRVLARLGDAFIVIDDLQWLDDLSRALMHHLLRAAQADGRDFVLLCAARPTAEATAFVRAVQRLFADTDGFVELSLPPLGREDGVQLAQLLDQNLDAERAEHIWAAASGSPFWIESAVQGSHDRDGSSPAVSDRFHALSADALSCLAALVVAGRPASTAELDDVLGWGATRLQAGLTELVDRGVVSSHAGSFHTAHDLVREAALANIPDDELVLLHRRYGELLSRRADGDLQLLMEALEHETAAGASTVVLALTIARSPQRRLLGESGLARLAAVAELPCADTAEATALELELAAFADELGDNEAALQRWGDLSDALDCAAARGQAAVRAARHGLDLGRSADMAVLLDRARTDCNGDAWLAIAIEALEYDRLVWLEHDRAAAESHLRAAIDPARRQLAEAGSVDALTVAQRWAYVEALDAECVTRMMDDDIDELLIASDEKIEATRGLGERYLTARIEACAALRYVNRWEESEVIARAVLQEARRQVYPGLVAFITYELAYIVHGLGRISDALELNEQARRLGERIDAGFETADGCLVGLSQAIEASASDWQSAVTSLREEAGRQPNPHLRMALWRRAATCAAYFGGAARREEVVAFLDAALADGRDADCAHCQWEAHIIATELFARVGDTCRARELLAAWDGEHPSPHVRNAYLRARAVAALAVAEGRADAADLLRDLRTSASAAGLRLDEVWALLDLGATLASCDRSGAVEAWTKAAVLAKALGASSEAALARRRLRTLGVHAVAAVTPPSADRASLAALSPRELDVAALAVQGVRNAEIAESLFISPKTVERHLSRIFAKLGVRNRAELTSRYAPQLAATPAARS